MEGLVQSGKLGCKFQLVGVGVEHLVNFEWAKISLFELLHWSIGRNITAVKEYEVSFTVGRGGSAGFVGMLFLCSLGGEEVCTQGFHYRLHLRGKGVALLFLFLKSLGRVASNRAWRAKAHAGMEALVSEKW